MNNDETGKIEMEDEDVTRIYVKAFLRYGWRRFITSLKTLLIECHYLVRYENFPQ